MAFTFTQARQLKPEQVNPFANLISKSLQGYGQGVKSAYLPQMLEADIFSKQLSPLATLATSPMFLQNPQFQAALGNLISRNLSMFGGKEFGKFGGENLPTYAEQLGDELENTGELAQDLTKGGKLKTKASGLLAGIQNLLGGAASPFTELFNQVGITPELSQKEKKAEDAFKRLKQSTVQSGMLSQADANDIFTKNEDETWEGAVNRINQRLSPLHKKRLGMTQQISKEDQNYQDNQELNEAATISEQIKQRTGKDIDPEIIFKYMQKNPGKIHIPSLLKKVG